jgi:hypothetical protein
MKNKEKTEMIKNIWDYSGKAFMLFVILFMFFSLAASIVRIITLPLALFDSTIWYIVGNCGVFCIFVYNDRGLIWKETPINFKYYNIGFFISFVGLFFLLLNFFGYAITIGFKSETIETLVCLGLVFFLTLGNYLNVKKIKRQIATALFNKFYRVVPINDEEDSEIKVTLI